MMYWCIVVYWCSNMVNWDSCVVYWSIVVYRDSNCVVGCVMMD